MCDVVYALHVEHIERAPWHLQAELRDSFEDALLGGPAVSVSPEEMELRRALGVA